MNGDVPVVRPKDILIEGAQILRPLLELHGFQFEFRGEGEFSGGHFAWGNSFERTGASNCTFCKVLDPSDTASEMKALHTNLICVNLESGNNANIPAFQMTPSGHFES